jgi:hypothetical protein
LERLLFFSLRWLRIVAAWFYLLCGGERRRSYAAGLSQAMPEVARGAVFVDRIVVRCAAARRRSGVPPLRRLETPLDARSRERERG